MPHAPGVRRLQVLVQPSIGVVDPAVKREAGYALLERLGGHALQQRDRIVSALAKLYGIDLPDSVLKKVYFGNALRIAGGLPQTGWPK